jgi:hypothetical protein
LDDVRACLQRTPDVGFSFGDEVIEEFLAPVAVEGSWRIEQAQCRRGDDRLLDCHLRIPERGLQVGVSVDPITERAAGQDR